VARPPRTDAEKMADEKLALRLLIGFTDDGTTNYKLTDEEEKQARAELARRVRGQITGIDAERLALAIDPDTPSKIPGLVPTRKIQFEPITRGPGATYARDQLVIQTINEELHSQGMQQEHLSPELRKPPQMEAAYAVAASLFNLRRSSVQSISKNYRLIFERARTRRVPAISRGKAWRLWQLIRRKGRDASQ